MRAIVFFSAALSAGVAGYAGAVGLPENSGELQRGLSTLRIVVDPLSLDAQELGFSEEVLAKEAARRLRSAGIGAESSARELLHIRFDAKRVSEGACEYSIVVEIQQPVALARNTSMEAYASTWYTNYDGPFVCSDVARLYPLALYAVDDGVAAIRGFQLPNREPPVLPRPVRVARASMATESSVEGTDSASSQLLESQLKAAQDAVSTKEATILALIASIGALSVSSADAEAQSAALIEVTAQRDALALRVGEIEKDLAAQTATAEALKRAESELALSREVAQTLNGKVAELERNMILAHSERYAATEASTAAAERLQRAENELAAARGDLAQAHTRVGELGALMVANQGLAEKLTRAESELVLAHLDADRLGKRVSELESTVAMATSERYAANASAGETLKKLAASAKEASDARPLLARLQSEARTLASRLSVAEARVASLQADKERLTQMGRKVADVNRVPSERQAEFAAATKRAETARKVAPVPATRQAGQAKAAQADAPLAIDTVPMSLPPVSPPVNVATATDRVAPAVEARSQTRKTSDGFRPVMVLSLPYAAIVVAEEADIRARPDEESTRLGIVKKGWKYTVVDVGGPHQEWLQIQVARGSGWVKATVLSADADAAALSRAAVITPRVPPASGARQITAPSPARPASVAVAVTAAPSF